MFRELLFGIDIGAFFIAFFVMATIIIGLLIQDDMSKPDNQLFLSICLVIILVIATDIGCELYQQVPIETWAFKLIMTINFVSINAYVVLFTFYMIACLKHKAYIDNSAGYSMVFIGGVGSILWAVDVYYETGIFVNILPGAGYTTADYYWVIVIGPLLIMIFDAFLALSFRKLLGISEILPWFAYACLPLLGLPLFSIFGVSTLYYAEILALLVVFIFEHSQRQKVAAITEKELTNSKMKLMLSQIQPHFMYNSLNSIYYLIEENPEEAQEAVSTFSDYLRQNINSLKSDKPVLFSEELAHTKAYLYLERVRFGEKLKVVEDISFSDFLIPPLTLQPLVENAVKHGLGPKGGDGTVTIKVYEDEVAYFIDVIDDGVGFDASAFDDKDNTHTHIGMYNVHSRLESICGASLEVKSEIGKGSVSSIRLPKLKQEELRKENAS